MKKGRVSVQYADAGTKLATAPTTKHDIGLAPRVYALTGLVNSNRGPRVPRSHDTDNNTQSYRGRVIAPSYCAVGIVAPENGPLPAMSGLLGLQRNMPRRARQGTLRGLQSLDCRLCYFEPARMTASRGSHIVLPTSAKCRQPSEREGGGPRCGQRYGDCIRFSGAPRRAGRETTGAQAESSHRLSHTHPHRTRRPHPLQGAGIRDVSKTRRDNRARGHASRFAMVSLEFGSSAKSRHIGRTAAWC